MAGLDAVSTWVGKDRTAGESNDPEDIGTLFAAVGWWAQHPRDDEPGTD